MDLNNKRSIHAGCTKQLIYCVDGTRTAEFCSEHKTVSMVNLQEVHPHRLHQAHKLCVGVAGTRTMEFCSEYKKDGMMHFKSRRRCTHYGCTKQSNDGVDGSNNTEFCSEHNSSSSARYCNCSDTKVEAHPAH